MDSLELCGVRGMFNELRPIQVLVDNQEIATENRIRVQGRANMTLLPDFFLIDIYNLTDEDMVKLRQAKKMLVYGEKSTLICSGDIEGLYQHEENSNDIISVSVSDGMEFWKSTVNVTVGSGAWMKDVVRMILKGASFGTFLCDNVRMPRGQTFSGKIADVIHTMAVSVRARAYIFCETLFMVGKESPTNVVKIENGLILKTRVTGYEVGNVVEYERMKYRVITRAVDADNYSGNWGSEITLIREDIFISDGMEGGF